MLSYLPMCYTLERCCQMVTVLGGGERKKQKRRCRNINVFQGRIGFYGGSMKGLGEDMRDLRPTLMPTVPRVLNRLYNDFTNTARRRFFGIKHFK